VIGRKVVQLTSSFCAKKLNSRAVLMAESSLQQAGRDIAAADRYQVMVS